MYSSLRIVVRPSTNRVRRNLTTMIRREPALPICSSCWQRTGYLRDKKTFPYQTFIIPDSCATPPFVPLHDRYSTSVVPNLNSNNRVLSYPVLRNSSWKFVSCSQILIHIYLIIIIVEKFILRLTAWLQFILQFKFYYYCTQQYELLVSLYNKIVMRIQFFERVTIKIRLKKYILKLWSLKKKIFLQK